MSSEPLPAPPLHVDARLVLETVQVGLVGVPAIAALFLSDENTVAVGVVVGLVMAMINRVLGKNRDDAVAEVRALIAPLLARNTVLVAAASPSVIAKADEAAEFISPTKETKV